MVRDMGGFLTCWPMIFTQLSKAFFCGTLVGVEDETLELYRSGARKVETTGLAQNSVCRTKGAIGNVDSADNIILYPKTDFVRRLCRGLLNSTSSNGGLNR